MNALSVRVVGKAVFWLWSNGYYDTKSMTLHPPSETLQWIDRFYPGGLILFVLEMED